MDLDYQTAPDIREKGIIVDNVKLFQRFRQRVDIETVEARFEAEIEKHLRLCELAILRAAAGTYYWCELPVHPLSAVNVWVADHLRAAGFILEHSREASNETAPSKFDKTKVLNTVRITTRWTASWMDAKSLDPQAVANEFRRRLKIEDAARKSYTPRPKSHIEGGKMSAGAAVWAALLDGMYIVEVQEIYHKPFLCIFTREGDLLHSEPTTIAYSAMFGPDSGDIAHWEKRATSVVDRIKNSSSEAGSSGPDSL